LTISVVEQRGELCPDVILVALAVWRAAHSSFGLTIALGAFA